VAERPIRVANAPCSWGVLEFEDAQAMVGHPTVLQEMEETGYCGTELGDWGFLPTEPRALQEVLAARSLALCGAFVPVALADETQHEAGEREALKIARLVAAASTDAMLVLADDNGKDPMRVALAGRIRPEHGLSDADWRIFARGAERIARAVRQETGLGTVFHHHCAGFIETPEEVARLMDLTDPDLLGLCLDTGHFSYGGGDALQAIARYGDRVRHVHFKDCEPSVAERARAGGHDYFQAVGNGVFCELGLGIVDFKGIIELLDNRDYGGWIVVEQDVLPGMGTPLDSARRNRETLRSHGI